MSRENVETTLRAFDAWNRGDREQWLAPAHPDVEWSSAIVRALEGAETVYRGRDEEVSAFWDDWHGVWNLELDVSETRDLGDTIVVLARMRTRGNVSGAEVERSIGYVVEFEDGLIRRMRAYLSQREALEAAGLSA
jgi:ketosteroid isomerase-like protein